MEIDEADEGPLPQEPAAVPDPITPTAGVAAAPLEAASTVNVGGYQYPNEAIGEPPYVELRERSHSGLNANVITLEDSISILPQIMHPREVLLFALHTVRQRAIFRNRREIDAEAQSLIHAAPNILGMESVAPATFNHAIREVRDMFQGCLNHLQNEESRLRSASPVRVQNVLTFERLALNSPTNSIGSGPLAARITTSNMPTTGRFFETSNCHVLRFGPMEQASGRRVVPLADISDAPPLAMDITFPQLNIGTTAACLLYTSPSPRD